MRVLATPRGSGGVRGGADGNHPPAAWAVTSCRGGAERTGGQARGSGDPRRCRRVDRGLSRWSTGPGRSGPAGRIRNVRPSRLVVSRCVQRGPHPRHDRGHPSLSGPARIQRPTLPRSRHARAVRASDSHRVERPRGPWRGRPGRPGRRLHADAGRLARHPRRKPAEGQLASPRRRDRGDAVAQPARRRRLQVQPAERRPGRYRRDALDPGRGEPDPGRSGIGWRGRYPPRIRDRGRRTGRSVRLPGPICRRPGLGHRHGRDPGVGAPDRGRPDGRRVGRVLGGDP